MFTGLIEEIGKIKAVKELGGGKQITVEADIVLIDLKIDDSIAMNGVCQTVIKVAGKTFDVIAVEETMRKTNFSGLKLNQNINLERALTLSTRLGGHLVQGHVDSVGLVKNIIKERSSHLVTIEFPTEFEKYIIPVGSICVNGVSLTAARVQGNTFTVAVIPHTWQVTTFGELKAGDKVNLEFDLIGKYIEKQMQLNDNQLEAGSILEQFKNQPLD